MFEQTKALCDRFLEMGIPGLDLMVCKDGQCLLRYTKGYADPDTKAPMTGKERYHIYSCSKLITCTAAMQLWEKGAFSLEDKLSDYIPAYRHMTVKTEQGVRPAKNPILIHHLFEMTSGMSYDLWNADLRKFCEDSGRRCSTRELVEQFAKTPLEFEPGDRWLYGLSHDVLAALVEIWSGQKFQDYVKEHIFDPLGMTHSDFLHPIEDWEGFPRQYTYKEDTKEFVPLWHNPYRPSSEYASGGAGCVSTVEDYMKLLEALRTGDVILKKETVSLMSANRLSEEQLRTFTYPTMGYGLGMLTAKEGSGRTDYGWGGAAGAVHRIDPVNNLSIYYAQHVILSPNTMLRRHLYAAIVADLKGENANIPELTAPTDPKITY